MKNCPDRKTFEAQGHAQDFIKWFSKTADIHGMIPYQCPRCNWWHVVAANGQTITQKRPLRFFIIGTTTGRIYVAGQMFNDKDDKDTVHITNALGNELFTCPRESVGELAGRDAELILKGYQKEMQNKIKEKNPLLGIP